MDWRRATGGSDDNPDPLELVHGTAGEKPRAQVRRARLSGHDAQRIHRLSQPADLSVPQRGEGIRLLPAPRFGAGDRLSERRHQRHQLQLLVPQRQRSADAHADAERRPALRSLLVVATRAGQPWYRPLRAETAVSGEPRLPDLQLALAAPVGDLRRDRNEPRGAQSELRPLRSVRIGHQRGERTGGGVGQSVRSDRENLHRMERDHSVRAGGRESGVGDRRKRQPADRSEHQTRDRRRVHRRHRSGIEPGCRAQGQRGPQARFQREPGDQRGAPIGIVYRRQERRGSRPRQRHRHGR